jgi:hypothetical protein
VQSPAYEMAHSQRFAGPDMVDLSSPSRPDPP